MGLPEASTSSSISGTEPSKLAMMFSPSVLTRRDSVVVVLEWISLEVTITVNSQ